MRVTCEKDKELKKALFVRPEGMMEAPGASHLWDSVSERIGPASTSILLDMSKVSFMSSAGLGILIRLLSRTQQAGGSLSIFACSKRVKTMLKIVQVESILNERESEEEARARLNELGVG
jgi:anti-anti-sigma factor